jgi:type I restriction enzyme S subunit
MSLPRYAQYKDSGVAWLGDVPAHWSVSRVKTVIKAIDSGVSVNAVDTPAGERSVGVLKTSCVYDGTFRFEENKAVLEDELSRVACAVEKDTVIVSRMNTPALVGAAGLVKESRPNIYLPDRLWQIHFQNCAPSFVHYWTLSPIYRYQVEIACAGTSSSMQNLGQDQFKSFWISLPMFSEQSAIAAFLDRETGKIDALIAEQEKLLTLLAEKRQATISHAVTRGLNPNAPMKDSGVPWLGEVPMHWDVTRCGRYLSMLSGFAFPSSGFDHTGNGTRLLRGVNVGVSNLRWDDVVCWERAPGDGLDTYELSAGDVVIGMDRPLISAGVRVAKVNEGDLPCLLLQRVASLRTSVELKVDFLMRYLSTDMFVAHFSPDTTGVSVPHISPDQIGSFVIAIPPTEEQRQILCHIEETLARLDRLAVHAEQGVALLIERRSALIAAAVTGKIDVRQVA